MLPAELNELVIRILGGEAVEHSAFGNTEQAGASLRAIADSLSFTTKDVGILADLLGKLIVSADPQMALNNLQRFAETTPDQESLRLALKRSPETASILVALMAGSQFLSDVLISQPDAFPWLFSHDTLHGARAADYYRDGAAAVVAGLSDRSSQRTAITRWRRREYLRIGCRDLLQLADAEDVSRDISDLAEAIIDQAALIVFHELSARFGVPVPEGPAWQETVKTPKGNFTPGSGLAYSTGMCVLGMGKLGGRELNFSSDIDLVFVYESEGETTGREDGTRRVAVISNHDFFTRVGESLVKFLAERGPEGNLFRVDMRLRPEGMDGPLARSLESFVHYLNTQGRDWERLAYLKARVVSGPVRLSEKLYRVMAEFVFAGVDVQRIVGEVQSLKMRIDREVMNSDLYRRDVKRGYGGIREIEFVVAAMQIIHGKHHHALRIRNTFLAIQRLRETHIITAEAAEFYQLAYSFLRTIEHRLQMAQEAQTHTLPPPGAEFEALARRCGFSNGEDFQLEYERITDAVHSRFTEFFERDTEAVEQAARDVIIILDRSATPEEARAALDRRGIDQPDSLRLIHALAYGTRDVFVSAEGQRSFEQMLPALLRMAAAAPFPERVLSQLHSFALAIKGITYYYEVIAQHPDILKLLVTLFGTSESLSMQLIAHPEFFDSLISTRTLNEVDPDGTQRRERMNMALSVRAPARRHVMLRRVVHFERLVLALKYLLRIEPLEDCLRGLSDTADHAIELATQMAAARLLSKLRDVERPDDGEVRVLSAEVSRHMAIVALGKYGGRELNFFGDLDVVFVYDSSELPAAVGDRYTSAQEFYDAFADAITKVLAEQMQGGRAFELDARLRPHGKSAPLTTELSMYTDYLSSQAEIWELQAFHRARVAWGSGPMLKNLHDAAQSAARQKSPSELKSAVREMRSRLEESVSGTTDQLEVKRSAGGIVDVEFILQYLVITARLPWNNESANYFSVLEERCPAILGDKDAAVLKAGYIVLRGVENTIRLVTGGSDSGLTVTSENSQAVARSLGFVSAELMMTQVQEIKQELRRVYDKHLAE